MPRLWRCANGHTWTGDIGALTFCPECNSRDVYEVRKPGVADQTPLPAPELDASFSQPRRAYRTGGSPPPVVETDSQETMTFQPADGVGEPAAATASTSTLPAMQSTVTQIPSSGPAIAPTTPPSELSTQEFVVAPRADKTTILLNPAAASEATLIQPADKSPSDAPKIPLEPGGTLVCHVTPGPGGELSPVCVPETDLPTYVESSTSDSTVDLPTAAQLDLNLPSSETTAVPGASDSTGSWFVGAGGDATVVTPDAQPATAVTPANSGGPPGSPGDTAETKVRVVPSQPKPAFRDSKTPQVTGYEILGVLGRGGMGVVYKARQKGLNRLVALKMIIGGAHAGEGDRGRFQAEALAVAKLQHTNIVQVYEVGERDGLPFFSLEYVDGGSLQQKMDGKPLPPRTAAAVVEQLARAVQYAHANGIVHRDLKPANILLKTYDGGDTLIESRADHGSSSRQRAVRLPYTPKITDFGLAKDLQSESGLTGTGAVMGTPSFMSPEQAEGRTREIGPPADIHALGAILYDALTGRPPFLGSDPMATVMQVRMMDPVPPSRWQPGLPRDLETVCLKCLEKSPARRYASAGELADDLRRFLDGEPVRARPTSAVEKCWKWARRRPTAAALIAVSVLALLAAVIVGFWIAQQQRDRAEKESNLRAIADQERDKAKLQSLRAQSNFDSAREVMEFFLTRVGDKRLRHVPSTERLQAELLESALSFYDRFLKTEQGTEPDLRREAGWAYQRTGRVREMLGKRTDAIAAYGEAVRIFSDLANQEPDEQQNPKGQADSLRMLVGALEADNQPVEADTAFVKAKTLLGSLAAKYPGEPNYRVELGGLLNTRGAQLASRRQLLDAIGVFREALETLGKGAALPSAPKDERLEAARTRANLGATLVKANQVELGRATLREAVEQFQQLVESNLDPQYARELGRAIVNLGSAHVLAQQPEQALDVYRSAGDVFARLAKQFPRVPDYRFELAKSYDNTADVLKRTTGSRAAEPEFEKARTIYRDLVAAHPLNDEYRLRYALSLDLFGVFLEDTGRRDEAITAVRESVALLQKLAADDPFDPDVQRHLGQRLVNLGILLTRDAQDSEAEKIYAQSTAVLEGALNHWPSLDAARKSLITACMNQASLMKHLNRIGEEEAAWVRVAHHQTKRATDFPDQPDVAADLARTLYTLAGLRIEKPAQAIATLRDAYDRQKSALALAPQRADLIANLGVYGTALVEALTHAGDHSSALKAAERVVAELPQNWPGLPKIGGFLSQCVRIAREDKKLNDGDRDKAVKQYGTAALTILRRAVANGFKDAASLQSAPELAALRESSEFKDEFAKLLDSIGKP